MLRAKLVAVAIFATAARAGLAAEPPSETDVERAKKNFDRLLVDRDYDRIDRTANELGFSGARFATGQYHFEALYVSMVSMIQLTREYGAGIAREWIAAKGPEGYAQLAQALVY